MTGNLYFAFYFSILQVSEVSCLNCVLQWRGPRGKEDNPMRGSIDNVQLRSLLKWGFYVWSFKDTLRANNLFNTTTFFQYFISACCYIFIWGQDDVFFCLIRCFILTFKGTSPWWIRLIILILKAWFFIYDCLNYIPYALFNSPAAKLKRSTRIKVSYFFYSLYKKIFPFLIEERDGNFLILAVWNQI